MADFTPISEDALYELLQRNPRAVPAGPGPGPAPSPHHLSIDEVLRMLDEQDAADAAAAGGGSPELGSAGAFPQMGSPPPIPSPNDFVHEPATRVPAPSGGAGYLRRLGEQFAARPIQYQTPRRGKASDAERFLMSLLAGTANGLGTNATRANAEDAALNLDLRTQAAERNKANAKATEDYRASLNRRSENKVQSDLIAGRELSRDQREAIQKQIDREYDLAKARIVAEGRASGGIGNKNDPSTYGDLASVAGMVARGETDLNSYPIYMRKPISDYMYLNGMTITPKKVRDTVQTLSAARAVVDELDQLSQGINTATNPLSRAFTGTRHVIGAATQSDTPAADFNSAREGFLAIISRAAGERGVLTDQDVARARRLLPGITDTKRHARNKLNRLRSLFDEIEARTRSVYTTAAGARSEVAPPASGLKPAADGSFDFVPGAR